MALGHWLKDYIGPHSGNGDPGYSCKTEITTVVNAAVTTVEPTDPDPVSPYPVGDIPYNKFLDAETIIVKFNGTDYICDRNTLDDSTACYGADGNQDYDWSEYPFRILTSKNPIDESEGNILYTENPGVYDIKIDEVKITVDITPCFAAAVKKVTGIV